MNNKTKWMKRKLHTGWTLVIAGILTSIVGIIVELQNTDQPYNYPIIIGLGILLARYGMGNLVLHRAALKNDQITGRMTVEDRDERTLLIRARAGNKAYWVSGILIYIGLMWTSFAANGSLPNLSGDVLWFFLAACTLVPFGIYIISILIDERNL